MDPGKYALSLPSRRKAINRCVSGWPLEFDIKPINVWRSIYLSFTIDSDMTRKALPNETEEVLHPFPEREERFSIRPIKVDEKRPIPCDKYISKL
jgi:hypothetical protein